MPSIASILKYLGHQPHSVGARSAYCQSSGRALPSTLSMVSKTVVLYLSAAICASHVPIVVTMDAPSTTLLNSELASDRSAETWRAHFAKLDEHRFHSLGMASDRGLGRVAGYRAACQEALWGGDSFHALQDLFTRRHQLESKAYAAISKEDAAAQKFAHATSESKLSKRLHQDAHAYQAGEHARAIYDQLARRLALLRAT